jgi:uncharacterized protein (TIGR03905 family)
MIDMIAMQYTYKTKGVCSSQIQFDIDGDDSVITNIVFRGGCDGNLKAIARLVDGWTAEKIAGVCAGNSCGGRKTSCADQLAAAVREAAASRG